MDSNKYPIWIYDCGFEKCDSEHSFGPAVRDHYLIHYIVSGKGTFTNEGGTVHLKENNGFLISPGEITTYKADKIEPWEYYWVGFKGEFAKKSLEDAHLNTKNPIFTYNSKEELVSYLQSMLQVEGGDEMNEMKRIGYFYLFAARLQGEVRKGNKKEIGNIVYLKKAMQYIENNYSYSISVTKIAAYVGIDRTYLFKIFKLHMDISPEKYILHYRLQKAVELLERTSYSIVQIAYSVGFKEASHFSRAFRERYRVSPREYRVRNDD